MEYQHNHACSTIGGKGNSWVFSAANGFDLTRSQYQDLGKNSPGVKIQTTTVPITINPSRSALIIIDMQNYFLSRALGRNAKSGRHLIDRLLQDAIPAARKAQMRVIWLNWGLDERDLAAIPPAVTRTFGFAGPGYAARRSDHAQIVNVTLLDKFGKPKSKSSHKYAGLGSEYQGIICDPDTGDQIHDPGLCLMKGAWNSALHPPLDNAYLEGSKLETRPDVLLHKNRMSGLCGVTSEFERFLHAEGITTLFFAGVDTDRECRCYCGWCCQSCTDDACQIASEELFRMAITKVMTASC